MNKLVSLALLRVSASVITKIRYRKHAFPLKEILRKRIEKWSGSVVTAATETSTSGVYPLPETHVSRCVSATCSSIFATIQSSDSWHFVLWLYLYGLEVRTSAYQSRYLDRIDNFLRRAYHFGYTNKIILISDVITRRDSDLFNRIISDIGHVLYNLLSPKRYRVLREKGHDFTLPKVKSDRFKRRTFVNRYLFKFFLNFVTFIAANFCQTIFT